jgi:gamma-glutamylcyclotransferase (GGCT)/AIG2-like uncharacterized protein YtfP
MLAGSRTTGPDMSSNIFTYGSLMFSDVWERVVHGRYRNAPATLAGHARYAITGETYPGMVARTDAVVTGVVYFDVAPEDLAALDAFEGEEYRRVTVTVAQGDARTSADTYLYLPREKLSDSPWNPDAFQMQRFLATYCRERLGE